MHESANLTPDPRELFEQFPPGDDFPRYEVVAPEQVPDPFRQLLVHEHHMTVTVEDYHDSLVDVHILAVRTEGASYSRKIVLTTRKTGRVVLFGIVRVNLDYCSQPVRDTIVEGKTPFGRILIEHNVMRRIEPTAYFRIDPRAEQLAWFRLSEPAPMYGRVGYIHCDGKPAVELFEVVVG